MIPSTAMPGMRILANSRICSRSRLTQPNIVPARRANPIQVQTYHVPSATLCQNGHSSASFEWGIRLSPARSHLGA